MAGYSIGGILAALLSMVIISNFGWMSVFFFGALPLLFLSMPVTVTARFNGPVNGEKKYQRMKDILVKVNLEYTPSENEEFVLSSSKKSSSPVITLFTENRAFSTIMIWVAYFMSLLMIYGLNTWLPKLMNAAGFPLGSSLGFLLALNVGATVGAIVMGWLADLRGVKKALILFYIVAAFTIASLGFARNTVLLYLLVAIAGAATIGTQNLANSYVSQYYPASIRSTGLGWALGIGRIGGIVGPTLGGILLASSLKLQLNFLAFAIPGIIAALAVFLTRKQTHETTTTQEHMETVS